MNKLTKEKRNQLILVAIATVGIIAAQWVFLIGYQREKLKEVAGKISGVQKETDKTQKVIREAGQIEGSLKEASTRLALIESRMPSGDLFAWMVTSIKQFNVPSYKVDMPQLSLPMVSEVPMFAEFPYHQATVSVAGTAYYYDLGKFIADYENRFPYSRIQNVNLEPGGNPSNPDDFEKLSFRMDLVTLVKATYP